MMTLKIKYPLSLILLFVLIIQIVSAETMCEFDFFVYKNDTVELIKAHSYIGNPESAELKKSDYALTFTDSVGNRIDEIKIPVIFYVLDPYQEVDSIPLSVRNPCDTNWDRLQIYHLNEKIFSTSVKGLICNNDNICNNYETVLTCPTDCHSGSKDGWCDKVNDGICDPDCITGDPDCKESKSAAIADSKEIIPTHCNENSICEIYENEVNCPSDCKKSIVSESAVKVSKISEKNLVKGKIKEGRKNVSSILIWVLVLLFIIMMIIIGYFRLKRK